MQLELNLLGKDKVVARFTQLEQMIDDFVEDTLREVCEKIKDTAKSIVVVKTGSLRDSIRIQSYARVAGNIIRMGVSAGGYVTNPDTGRKVDYAAHVEFGTIKMRERPYLGPAMELHARELNILTRDKIRESRTI